MKDSSVVRRVSPQSLPTSLTFFSKVDALEEARALAKFLQDASEAMAVSGALDSRNSSGLRQCFALLRDQLDIVAGAYRFPLAGSAEDPELCHRVEDSRHEQY